MTEVLVRAACFITVIFSGALLRWTGFFQKGDFHLLSAALITAILLIQ